MTPTLAHSLTFGASLLGFAALAFAMVRHQEDTFGRALAPRTTRWLRIAGWGLLLLALAAAIAGFGTGLGLVTYSGHTSAAAGVVFVALLLDVRRRERAKRPPARAPKA